MLIELLPAEKAPVQNRSKIHILVPVALKGVGRPDLKHSTLETTAQTQLRKLRPHPLSEFRNPLPRIGKQHQMIGDQPLFPARFDDSPAAGNAGKHTVLHQRGDRPLCHQKRDAAPGGNLPRPRQLAAGGNSAGFNAIQNPVPYDVIDHFRYPASAHCPHRSSHDYIIAHFCG